MRKFIISLILLFSLLLSGCDIFSDVGGDGGDGSGAVATEGHEDGDNDGECDDCGEGVIIELDLFAVNDMHGKLTDGGTQPGAEELTTYLKSASATEPNAVILSSGDMWQGSSESNLTGGLIMTDWMNELGFVSMTLGNHEFDWGESAIDPNLVLAEFPFLAINVYEKATDGRAEYATPSVIVEKSGLEIGIIGAIGDCYSSISADKVEDIYFKVGDELTELIKAESARLRAAGADLIVYSLHDGYGSSRSGESVITDASLAGYYSPELSREGYVDIVFEAHTHQTYVAKDAYGVYHIQAGGENNGLSHAEILVNFANGTVLVTEAEIISSSIYGKYSPDSLVDTLLAKYADEVAAGDEILGNNVRKRYSEELEQLVADLYLSAGLKRWGEKYDVVLGGGFIKARSPYNLAAGEVRYAELQMLFPFDNELKLCSIRGSDLKSKFLETQHSDYFIALSEFGESVKEDIVANKIYYVVVDSYTALYAPNRLTVVDTYDSSTFARDLLKEYIKSGGLE